MRFILLSAFIFFSGIISAQLSGNVVLPGLQNHSGVKVRFKAHSITAVTDSTLTDAAGNYSINIASGVYDIMMSKTSFLNCYYADSQTSLLTNTTVLTTMTLIPGNQVLVSGNVSGVWTANNTYIVVGHVTVPSNSTLFIQAGTNVRFFGYNSIIGLGCITAGSPGGAYVKFTSHRLQPAIEDWNQFQLSGTCSTFERCIFEYANWPIHAPQGAANVSNSIFRHFKGIGIYCGAGSPIIDGNEIHSAVGDGDAVVGIFMQESSTGTVSCNYIHDLYTGHNSYGMINNNSLIIDNRIENIKAGSQSQGIESRFQNSLIMNNSISNCEIGIDLSADIEPTSPKILNNTIFACVKGITREYAQFPVSATISNNIITGNKYGIFLSGSGTTTISSNLVWNNSTANYSTGISGLGQTMGNNSQGYPIDTYLNMSQDPLYVNNIPPLLSTSSPCHTTGNPVFANHMGFVNPTDCAAKIVGVAEFESKNSLKLYPVPCDDQLFIPKGSGKVCLYDLMGNMVLTYSDNNNGVLNVSELASGCYFITITSEFGIKSGKVIVQH